MGLKQSTIAEFTERYRRLHFDSLVRRGVVFPIASNLCSFDEEEVAALHAEELLKEHPQSFIEDYVASSLRGLIGAKLPSIALVQAMVDQSLRALQLRGDVDDYKVQVEVVGSEIKTHVTYREPRTAAPYRLTLSING